MPKKRKKEMKTRGGVSGVKMVERREERDSKTNYWVCKHRLLSVDRKGSRGIVSRDLVG